MNQLSPFEAMQRIYVLQETKELLTQKLNQSKEAGIPTNEIEDDLAKMEDELKDYMGQVASQKSINLNKELIIPDFTEMD